MTSKEALELLFKNVEENFKKRIRIKNYYVPQLEKDCYEIIKQDLDRLEVLISILQKFIDEDEYFVLHDKYLSLGIDGSINITQQQCDVLKSVLRFKE